MAYEFEDQTFDGLKPASRSAFDDVVGGMIPAGEEVIAAFRAGKGGVLFTSQRVLAVDTKGLTGKQKIVIAVPYDKVSAYAFEGTSLSSFDGRITLWNRGIGTIVFAFDEKTDVSRIAEAVGKGS